MTSAANRQTPRHDIALRVGVTRGEQRCRGTTKNVSLGGLKMEVALDPAPQVGERFMVHVELPTLAAAIDVEAEVRWMSADGRVLGLQFVTGLRAKETYALSRFLEIGAIAS